MGIVPCSALLHRALPHWQRTILDTAAWIVPAALHLSAQVVVLQQVAGAHALILDSREGWVKIDILLFELASQHHLQSLLVLLEEVSLGRGIH